MYLVLSLDGGGVRAVLTARLLENIVAARPHFLEGVDLFAGTSAGAISAVGLALGMHPAQITQLYRRHSHELFRSSFHELVDRFRITSAKYHTADREHAIREGVREASGYDLRELPMGALSKKVIIATFQLDSENPLARDPALTGDRRTWKAKFFHNFPTDNNGEPNPDLEHSVLDVVLRSSAAPTYFPIYQGFIDGSVIASNPSVCALAQAINERTGAQQIQNVALLSVGAGDKRRFLEGRNDNWGLGQWGTNLIDLLFDTGAQLADYQCRQLLGNCYHRLNAVLRETVDLDDADKVEHLISVADRMSDDGSLQETLEWISARWQ